MMVAKKTDSCFASKMLMKHTEYGSPEWYWCFDDAQIYHWNKAKAKDFKILTGEKYCNYKGFKAIPEIHKIAEKLDFLWSHLETH